MPFTRNAAVAAVALLAVAAAAPAGAQTTSPAPADKAQQTPETDPAKVVVARIGDATITLADLAAMREDLPPQYRQMPLQAIYPALLERAIDGELIAQAARSAKLGERPDVQRRLRRAQDQVLSQVYLSEEIAAEVTEEALRKRYDQAIAEGGSQEEAHAKHILVETEEQAKSVIAELDKGAEFPALAKQHSTDPGGADGGDLGWFTAEQMVPEFSKAAFGLAPGTYTKEPVKSQFGWHVILLVEKRTAEPPPFEQMRDQLASELTRELINKKLETLRTATKVQRFAPDGSPIASPH